MKKSLLSIATLSVALTLLSGCGGGTVSSSVPSSSSSSSSSSPAPTVHTVSVYPRNDSSSFTSY